MVRQQLTSLALVLTLLVSGCNIAPDGTIGGSNVTLSQNFTGPQGATGNFSGYFSGNVTFGGNLTFAVTSNISIPAGGKIIIGDTSFRNSGSNLIVENAAGTTQQSI